MRAWIHSPELAARAQKLGEFLRYGSSLGPVWSELAILITARFWSSSYVFESHARSGQQAGLDPAIIAAIAAGRQPVLNDPKARAIHAYATVLHRSHFVPEPIHEEAVRQLGEAGVVELVGLLGYYTLAAMTANAFLLELPAEAKYTLQYNEETS
jgi:4-carboxymuconolactone decarboxylase